MILQVCLSLANLMQYIKLKLNIIFLSKTQRWHDTNIKALRKTCIFKIKRWKANEKKNRVIISTYTYHKINFDLNCFAGAFVVFFFFSLSFLCFYDMCALCLLLPHILLKRVFVFTHFSINSSFGSYCNFIGIRWNNKNHNI